MRHRPRGVPRCTYLVVLERENGSVDDLRELAAYLSHLAVSDIEVLIVDACSSSALDCHRRVLRWVGRYVIARPRHLTARSIDPIRVASDLASSDKVIFAYAHIRYTDEAITALCHLLESHEVVEPQDYFDPLPWWSGIDAGRLLIHRGIGPLRRTPSTFGFQKKAVRGLRSIDTEVFAADQIFVRRVPPSLAEWVRDRGSRYADIDAPPNAAFFFVLLPIALALAFIGGASFAGGYAGAIAFAAVALAVRGRVGAAAFFPWRACLYAPLWILERSVSVYMALFRTLGQVRRTPTVARNERSATGETPAASTR